MNGQAFTTVNVLAAADDKDATIKAKVEDGIIATEKTQPQFKVLYYQRTEELSKAKPIKTVRELSRDSI